MNSLTSKIVIPLTVLLFAIITLGNFSPNLGKYTGKVSLGIDLNGGSYIRAGVDLESFFGKKMKADAREIVRTLREKNIRYTNIFYRGTQLSFRSQSNINDIKAVVKGFAVNYDPEKELYTVSYDKMRKKEMISDLFKNIKSIIYKRIDPNGDKGIKIYQKGDSGLIFEVPKGENIETVKSLISSTAEMSFRLLDPTAPFASTQPPRSGFEIMPSYSDEGYYNVSKEVLLEGANLKNSNAVMQQGEYVVNFEFNSRGSIDFGNITKQNSGKMLAIVLDNKVISAPMIREPILGGKGVISGNFTPESATSLASLLKSGALPAKLNIETETTIGSIFGNQTISHAKYAAIASLACVIIIMLAIYRGFGVVGIISVVVNIMGTLAALSFFNSTLTLSGLAGIILTLGIGVDANIIIFERIKEYLHSGLAKTEAIQKGFKDSFLAIVDANITTMIAAIVIYSIGTGSIKGFGLSLGIGIIMSMFSSLSLSRLLIHSPIFAKA